MAEIIVVGGGVAGLATAARLAKLGHTVTLQERSSRLGGAVRRHAQDGFGWDLGPATWTLPAALRDLFVKSGRPIERVLELEPVSTPRRHVWPDGTVLELPLTGRRGQHDAISTAFGRATADAWTELVDDCTQLWEVLRKNVLEAPFPGWRRLGPRHLRRLAPWRSLGSLLGRRLPDRRAREAFAATVLPPGMPAGRAPAYLAVAAYVERTFGRWHCAGGPSAVIDALETRLAERGVRVELDTEVTAIELAGPDWSGSAGSRSAGSRSAGSRSAGSRSAGSRSAGCRSDGPKAPRGGRRASQVAGVLLANGEHRRSDIVVSAVPAPGDLLADPPAALRRTARLPSGPVGHLVGYGLAEPVPGLPFETVHHGRDTVVRASSDGRTLTMITYSGTHSGTHFGTHFGPDLSGLPDLIAESGTSTSVRFEAELEPERPVWGGRPGVFRRLAPTETEIRGLYCVGAIARPGPGLPCAMLGAALAATAIGAIARPRSRTAAGG